jgi:hypothetical protein
MPKISGRGLAVDLPPGWEAHIFQRRAVGGAAPEPVMHVANFPIPPDAADFGGGVTPHMAPRDIFVVLFEYGRESLGRRLFEQQGMPRQVPVNRLSRWTLRRGVSGQAGTQFFFTDNDRPFTLYAVLGSFDLRHHLLPQLNDLLARIEVGTRELTR